MEMSHSESLAIPALAPAEHGQTAARFFTPKVAVWAVLACVAAAYLAVLAINPGVIATYLPSAMPSANPEDNEGQRAATASVDAKDLRNSVQQLQLDVDKIKTDLAAKDEQDKAVATRLAVLEETKRGGPAVAVADPSAPAGIPVTALSPAPATAAAKAAAKKAAAAVKVAPVPATVPAVALAPAIPVAPAVPAAPLVAVAPAAALAPIANPASPAPAGVKLINAPLSASTAAARAAPAAAAAPTAAVQPAVSAPVAKPAPAPTNAAAALAPALETGSVQNLSTSPAPAATGARPIGIYIGSGPSVDSLRLSWSLLSDRNADTLKALEPRYTTGIDGNGLNYGLVAGPVKSAADAQKLCRDLAAKAVTCRVGDFTGEAL